MDNYMDDLKDFENNLNVFKEETYEQFKDRFFSKFFNKVKPKIKENYELGIKSFSCKVPDEFINENFLNRIEQDYFNSKIFFKLIKKEYEFSMDGAKYYIDFFWA